MSYAKMRAQGLRVPGRRNPSNDILFGLIQEINDTLGCSAGSLRKPRGSGASARSPLGSPASLVYVYFSSCGPWKSYLLDKHE